MENLGNPILLSLFSSSVLATIITASITFYNFHRKSLIENITSDRKLWRTEIKEIADKLSETDDYTTICQLISKLEIRINIYGLGKNENYLKDNHIWSLIEKIRQCPANMNALKVQKKKLIRCIATLLKYDWERSKDEVRGNTYYRIILLSYLLSFSIGFFTILVATKDELIPLSYYYNFDYDLWNDTSITIGEQLPYLLIVFRLVSSIIQVVSIIIPTCLFKKIFYKYLYNKKIMRYFLVVLYLALIILIGRVTNTKISLFSERYIDKTVIMLYVISIFLSYIISSISGICYLIEHCNIINEYNKAIHMILSEESQKRSIKKSYENHSAVGSAHKDSPKSN